jgi:hypothetical protein
VERAPSLAAGPRAGAPGADEVSAAVHGDCPTKPLPALSPESSGLPLKSACKSVDKSI